MEPKDRQVKGTLQPKDRQVKGTLQRGLALLQDVANTEEINVMMPPTRSG